MSARVCITCSRAFDLETFDCPNCGSRCDYTSGVDPDPPLQLELTGASAAELWRFEQLLAAGYPLDAAEQLAARTLVDLHQAVELVQRGCRPELAAQILL